MWNLFLYPLVLFTFVPLALACVCLVLPWSRDSSCFSRLILFGSKQANAPLG
ncbi:hypothetical protein L873DRAFT_1804016 [Choiromyces venosus 120613-1]|uniref:Uncharacterized protein n=1 Tax=Choiromyces venosus 120613-1 TaxID=1336337 RepID=A0A3N4K5E4_9PEZI|nr:hypothetical protein L873DRAFT_1804016 [Choiromyces venosus 120613-1]